MSLPIFDCQNVSLEGFWEKEGFGKQKGSRTFKFIFKERDKYSK